jgi:DMSO reductase anchor subunit
MLFTLLTQMAVGGFWAVMWMFSLLWSLVEFDSTGLRLLPSLLVGTSLGVGMLASFAHLGTKKNAWRMLSHWRKSSLSREILFAILFGFGWLFTALEILIWHQSTFEWIAITAILGIGLIYHMSQVYRIPAATGWNSWRTNASFLVSSLLLGLSLMTPILAYELNLTGIYIPSVQWITITGSMLILLLAELLMINRKSFKIFLVLIRIELIVVSTLIITSGLLFSTLQLTLTSVLLFLTIICQEAIGKWIFYASRRSL